VTLRLLAPTLIPLLAALTLVIVGRSSRLGLPVFCGLAAAAAFGALVSLLDLVLAEGHLAVSLPWAPSVGLNLSLYVDGLSLLFAGLILGIGLLVIVYARYYLAAADAIVRFYAALMLFMAAMVGVVTSGNLLLLVVFWELTSISSFLLIGFWNDREESRRGAYQSLMVTAMGGLALLAGVLLVGVEAGTFELTELFAQAERVRQAPMANVALALILVGAFTKSAQFPFHFWLPNAMAAPTPVSAYLHSATMVKAGIFLLARLSPLFAATDLWFFAVTGIGATTMLVGGWGALRQTDLKALLAYSTISQLGMIVMLYGYGTELATVAATLHILNHAAFKAPLFMAAGIIDHETGSRDIAEIGGLRHALPRTTLLACCAAAAMAGAPLLNGFVSKELFYEASLVLAAGGPALAWVLPALALVGSALTVAYTLRFVLGAFFGEAPRQPTRTAHEPPAGMRLPAELLVALCFAVGVMPALAESLIGAAASSIVGATVNPHFKIWHGFNPALGLSFMATVIGLAVYYVRRSSARRKLAPSFGRSAAEHYDQIVANLLAGAQQLTDRIQSGKLHWYVRIVLATVVGASSIGLLFDNPEPLLEPATPVASGGFLVAGLTATTAVAVAAFIRQRLASVIALGAVGLFVALYFVWLSAPDLVITQLLVEAVTTILIVLVLYHLPKDTPKGEPLPRLSADVGFAAIIGLGAAGVVYAVLRRPFESISAFHLAKSKVEAGGTNVVNVILVDFRGYDTLGEIVVLAIAAIGVIALVRAGKKVAS